MTLVKQENKLHFITCVKWTDNLIRRRHLELQFTNEIVLVTSLELRV